MTLDVDRFGRFAAPPLRERSRLTDEHGDPAQIDHLCDRAASGRWESAYEELVRFTGERSARLELPAAQQLLHAVVAAQARELHETVFDANELRSLLNMFGVRVGESAHLVQVRNHGDAGGIMHLWAHGHHYPEFWYAIQLPDSTDARAMCGLGFADRAGAVFRSQRGSWHQPPAGYTHCRSCSKHASKYADTSEDKLYAPLTPEENVLWQQACEQQLMPLVGAAVLRATTPLQFAPQTDEIGVAALVDFATTLAVADPVRVYKQILGPEGINALRRSSPRLRRHRDEYMHRFLSEELLHEVFQRAYEERRGNQQRGATSRLLRHHLVTAHDEAEPPAREDGLVPFTTGHIGHAWRRNSKRRERKRQARRHLERHGW